MALTIFQEPSKQLNKENNFYQFLIEKFSDTDMSIGLFFDVAIGEHQFSCLLLSPKGITVLEYIDSSGRLIGQEDSVWTIENSNGQSFINNPIFEMNQQRRILMNFFNNDGRKNLINIFGDKVSENLDTRHISFFLCFEQLTSDSKLLMDKKTSLWFKLTSKKMFISDFDSLRTSQFTFTENDSKEFSKALKIEDHKQQVHNESLNYCFVCDYSAQKCDQKYVNGYVVGVSNDIIQIQTRNVLLSIKYSKSDLIELKLINDFYKNVKEKMNVKFEINLFHLIKIDNQSFDFAITDYSIITIQPAWLVNVTDFTSLSFCERQAITRQFSKNPMNEAILKGISVNEAIKDLIPSQNNIYDKKNRINNSYQSVGKYLRSKIVECSVSGVASGQAKEDFKDKIKFEIKNIANWIDGRSFKGDPKYEEFVISPKLGLRGKLDIVFKDKNEILDIIELKSSKKDYFTNGIQFYHELQVVAYCMMVMLKQKKSLSQSSPSVIYSRATTGIETNATLNFQTFTNVAKFRNILLSSNIGLELPAEIDAHHAKYKKKCIACSDNDILKNITSIKDSDNSTKKIPQSKVDHFQFWCDFINTSKIDSYLSYNKLMGENIEIRKQKGKVVEGEFSCAGSHGDDWKYSIALTESNRSDFRDRDLILIMEKENYYNGEAKVGQIYNIENDKCEIIVNEKIDFIPRYISSYYNDSNDKINSVGLYNAFFNNESIYHAFYDDFSNDYIKLIRKLDLNLILGPPGSGKTTTICSRIINDIMDGKTIFVMCFTNRALDEIEQRLREDIYFNNKYFEDIVYRFNRKPSQNEKLENLSAKKIKVFLSTVHGTKTQMIDKWKNDIDICYIDEASQLNFTMCSNGFLARKHILVGDYNQLSPLVPMNLSAKFDKEIVKKSFFEILWKKIQKNDIDERCSYLSTQYRMNKEIAHYPFSKWYSEFRIDNFEKVENDKLKYFNNEWMEDEYKNILDPDIPSIWVQVDSNKNNANTKANLEEANVCCKIIEKFVKYGQDIKSNIGVIAPFRRQVNEIKNLVAKNIDDKNSDLVDTVDRFQGSQKEIIIISICSGENDNFLESDYRRLNVALTRSKFKRIIVGDISKAGKDLGGILNDGYTQMIKLKNKDTA